MGGQIQSTTQAATSTVTSAPNRGPTSTASWTPPSGSTLYNDRVKVTGDELVIQASLQSKSTSTSLSTLQTQYNQDLATYQKDLEDDLKNIKATPGAEGRGQYTTQQQQEQSFDNDEKDAIEGTNQKADYHQLTFTDPVAGSSHAGGTVSADGFPGGQGDPEFFGAENLQKGYVAPPAISSGSDISTVYNNLDSSQAAYLGWALQETDAGKQVTIPSGDLQSWNLLSEYAKQNNHELGTGNPDSSKDTIDSVDDKVESSFTTNQKTDPGKIVMEAFTGIFTLGLQTSVSGIIPGQAGKILGNIAGAAGAAALGVGLGGEIAGAGAGALTGGAGGVISDAAGLLSSIKNILASPGLSEAGSALLEEVDEIAPTLLNGGVDGYTLNDTFDKGDGEK